MKRDLSSMSEEEIQAEIMRLQAVKVPTAKPKRQPKRLDAAINPNKKKTWRDELFS